MLNPLSNLRSCAPALLRSCAPALLREHGHEAPSMHHAICGVAGGVFG